MDPDSGRRGVFLPHGGGSMGSHHHHHTHHSSEERPGSDPGIYGELLRDFESLQEKYRVVREAYEDLSGGERSLETCCQTEIVKYKTLYQEMLSERNQFKQQCTQAIKQWDVALRERNEYKDALSMVQRKHDEAVKEVNQVISVKLKASKDLKRLTDERNAAMQEYSLIMSERDSVHKEIERLQDEISNQKKRASAAESQSKLQEVDRRKMYCHIEILKREIENSLGERDKALKEVQELREKIGISSGCNAVGGGRGVSEDTYLYLKNCKNFIDKMDTDRTKRKPGELVKTLNKCETLDQANSEICRLLKLLEKLQMDLHDARIEADIDKGRRDLAFSERDKILLEREAIRTLCDKLRHERDRADSDLADATREASELKSLNKRLMSENSKLRSRIDEFKKSPPLLGFRSSSSKAASHSIDGTSFLGGEECPSFSSSSSWEKVTLSLKRRTSLEGDLGFRVVEDKELRLPRVDYVAPDLAGKMQLDDYLTRINDTDTRSLPLESVSELLLSSSSHGPRLVLARRRRPSPVISSQFFNIQNNQEHGISLESGIFVSGIVEGSLAQGRIRVGDRVLALDDLVLSGGEEGLKDAREVLAATRNSLRVQYLRANVALPSECLGGAKDSIKSSPPSAVVVSRRSREESLPLPTQHPTPPSGKSKKREASSLFFGGTWPRVKSGHGDSGGRHKKAAEAAGRRRAAAAAAAAASGLLPGKENKKKESPPESSSVHHNSVNRRSLVAAFIKSPSEKGGGKSSSSPPGAAYPDVGDASVKSAHGRDEDVLVRYLRRSKEVRQFPLPPPQQLSSQHLRKGSSSIGGGIGCRDSSNLLLLGGMLPPKRANTEATLQHTLGRNTTTMVNSSLSPRIRIPSNTSVTSNSSVSKMSTSSMDKSFNKCSSPLPFYSIEYLSTDGRISESLHLSRKSVSGEIRQISIQKSSEQLGFTIEEGAHKGVFVSSVNENSLAQLVGLQVGDQLLEVCGINLRSCGKEQAARVLHQVGHSITLKVQYNPGDSLLNNTVTSCSSSSSRGSSRESSICSSPGSSNTSSRSSSRASSRRHSSQSSIHHHHHHHTSAVHSDSEIEDDDHHHHHIRDSDEESSSELLTAAAAASGSAPPSYADSTRRSTNASPPYEPRLVFPSAAAANSSSPTNRSRMRDLGVRLVGGNAVGIFVHSVEPGSPACIAGLRSADQILEYDGVDLSLASAEAAAYELAKPPCRGGRLLVQYNPDVYTAVKDGPGDSVYVRCLFDRGSSGSGHELGFARDDVLYVDNTMYNGVPGHWSAWALDADGRKAAWGIIPSKYKVEEELLTRKSLGNLDVERRGWTSTRRSFFKRRKAAGGSSRSGSVPKELASYSDMGSLSDSGNLLEETSLVHSYMRVERFDSQVARPVLLIGPYAELFQEKLVHEYSHKFLPYEPELLDEDDPELLGSAGSSDILDARRRRPGRLLEITRTSALLASENNSSSHVLLNIQLEAVERLHAAGVYPIVLLLKFKSIKHIREMRGGGGDPRSSSSGTHNKISGKDAKSVYEQTLKLEGEHRHLISDIVHAGANLMLICTQIVSQIEQEQSKTLWVPSGSIW